MRFLCLHGWGINSDIFETQIAAFRYQVGNEHAFEFVDGSFACPPLPGIEVVYGQQQECYAYFDPTSLSSIRTALEDLKAYIDADGPFDGILGYSQGAAIAATLLVQDKIDQPSQLNPLFKCAVFLSGGVPFDPAALRRSEVRFLNPAVDGQPITIPSAHIWGSNDTDFPDTSPRLSKLCMADIRTEIIHGGGHEIPPLKGDFLAEVIDAFRKTVDSTVSRA